MARKYREDPIVEAVCELRLLSDSPWDLATPGLLYESLRGRFPHREQEVVSRVEIASTESGTSPQIQVTELIRFVAEDRLSFVRISPRSVSLHRLRPYESWESFLPDIELMLQSVVAHVRPNALEREGLRYINRIEVPWESIDLEAYFGFRPTLDPPLPQNLTGFIVGAVFPFDDERDSCRVQLSDAVADDAGKSAFLLDLDYWTARPEGLAVQDVLSWAGRAHERVESIFEGCISDSLREVFGVIDAHSPS